MHWLLQTVLAVPEGKFVRTYALHAGNVNCSSEPAEMEAEGV